MGFKLAHLYRPPAVNPVTFKARSIPFFNPIDVYGRVFFFSWFGFMIAFWAWYTFPPLVWPVSLRLTGFMVLTLPLVDPYHQK
jgi:NNP family nitrate/nitrite transporter-like MFS transporter